MSIETTPFDPALYIEGPERIAAYLDEAFATNDPAFIADALGVVARSVGMADLARKASVSRESLYRALTSSGNPELNTVLKVMSALGVRLNVSPSEGVDHHGAEAAAG